MYHIVTKNGVPTLHYNEKEIMATTESFLSTLDAKVGLTAVLDFLSMRTYDESEAVFIFSKKNVSDIDSSLDVSKEFAIIAKIPTRIKELDGESVEMEKGENHPLSVSFKRSKLSDEYVEIETQFGDRSVLKASDFVALS